MRFTVLALLLLAPLAFAGGTHRTHIIDDDMEIRIVRDDDGDHYASFKRDGVRYTTTDSGVLAQIERAMEPHRELTREHSRLGREHSALGREHSALGREHSRLGREHSRLARDRALGADDVERRQRELEAEQRKLEEKQRRLEDKQRDLEAEQRALESRQRSSEREMRRAIEQIFERAVREGKAKRGGM